MSTSRSEIFRDVTSELLRRGHRVRFRAEGDSMVPTIRGGEAILVEPVAPAELRQGDIALYRAKRGLTAHRVVRVETRREPVAFAIRGDAAGSADEWVEQGQIMGRVIAVEQNRRRILLDARRAKWSRSAWSCRLLLQGCAKRLLRGSTARPGHEGWLLALLVLTLASFVPAEAQVGIHAFSNPTSGSLLTSARREE